MYNITLAVMLNIIKASHTKKNPVFSGLCHTRVTQLCYPRVAHGQALGILPCKWGSGWQLGERKKIECSLDWVAQWVTRLCYPRVAHGQVLGILPCKWGSGWQLGERKIWCSLDWVEHGSHHCATRGSHMGKYWVRTGQLEVSQWILTMLLYNVFWAKPISSSKSCGVPDISILKTEMGYINNICLRRSEHFTPAVWKMIQ